MFSVKGVPPELVPMKFPSIVLFEPPLTSTETSSPLLASSAITLAPTPALPNHDVVGAPVELDRNIVAEHRDWLASVRSDFFDDVLGR